MRALDPETATSSLGGVLDLGAIEEREIYAALDWLLAQQARIERASPRHLGDGTLVLYDVSSSYLEGRKCELAQHGYSRDHRTDKPQIVYGLLCNRDGRPIAIEVFDGNTADPGTLGAQMAKVKQRFGLRRSSSSAIAASSPRRVSARNSSLPGSIGSPACARRRSRSSSKAGRCRCRCSTNATSPRSARRRIRASA